MRDILLNKLNKLKEPKILVVGDFAIDEMIYGSTQKISREAPVLVLEHSNTKIILGTASNAANNVAKLNGAKVVAIGTYGEDYHADVLLNALKEAGIDTKYMILDKTRKTTTKTRISGSCSQSITQQIVRIDRQTKAPLSTEIEEIALNNIRQAIIECDGVILSDYHLGFLTDNIIKETISLAKIHNKIIVADVQKDFERYFGVDAITPNQADCEQFLGYFINDNNIDSAIDEVIDRVGLNYMLLTRGADGMVVASKNDKIDKKVIPAFNKKEVFDVTGAGDTVVAVFTLALCSGFNAHEAAILGNLAASIVIRYFGCHTTNIDTLKQELLTIKEII